ncbi:serine/threonine protein kinase [Cladophialophora psammophila CBS 110553]|uniref:Serine/threonine protein kinase n=1 Tax=Cladophialophora psammophila CBS 110553 TaxID=1182543 RepID=W9VT46_9EURO|nr:serine/threonine protein kinase [Cladophialophora psammophila CBS 110553]EXJ56210.1 serine/threonine protein kinase [Cladophialophora psammophila CBS 110553]
MAFTKSWRDTIFPGSTPDSAIEEIISAPGQVDVLENYASGDSSENRDHPLLGSGVPQKRLLTEKAGPSTAASPYDDPNEASVFKRKRREHQVHIPPRTNYHEFMDLDQAGTATMACEYDRSANIVAIKRLRGIDASSTQLGRPFVSDTVVSIINMYFDGDLLTIIYEPMDISLRKVTSILKSPLKHFHIAAICKELVAGLSYIHDNLSHYHGDLSCGTIMLNLDGSVKIGKSKFSSSPPQLMAIANIGESFARNRIITAETRQHDIRTIGFVMMELMEPTTYILDPQSAGLQNPGKWKEGWGIKDFLRATQHQSLEGLKNVSLDLQRRSANSTN